MYDRILFLDFDGTITSEETLEGSMMRTIDHELYKEKHAELLAGKITLNEALHMGFATVPSDQFPVIEEYVRGVSIRPGFAELLDAMEEVGIPVVVISGGLRPCIEEKLAPYRDKLLDVYSVDVDLSGRFIKLLSPFEEKGDLMEKTRVMELYDYKMAICAGDSHTDVRMAQKSDLVFARDNLPGLLDKVGVEYKVWEDFSQIKDEIIRSL